jgi:hypothetical protein
MPAQVKINYNGRNCRIGMSEVYTRNMIAAEFATIVSLPEISRDARVPDTESGQVNRDEELKLMDRIREQKARGTVINSLGDQMGMLDYCAHARIVSRCIGSDGSRELEYR